MPLYEVDHFEPEVFQGFDQTESTKFLCGAIWLGLL